MNDRKWVAGIVPLLVFLGLIALAAGCRTQQVGIPAASPAFASPTPVAAQVTPLPNGVELLHASQDALELVPAVGLVERLTSYRAPGGPPLVVAQETCFRLEGSGGWKEGPFLSSVEAEYPDGLDRRTICTGNGPTQTCHTQVHDYPWFRDSTVEGGAPWPRVRRELLAEASAPGSTTLAEDGTLFVTWTAESPLFGGLALRGESWLDASSLHPRREVIGWYSQEMLSVHQEITYTDCAEAEQLGMPPLATITPAAPITPPPEAAEFREESVPLPGALYVPEGEGPFPAAVVLHGSEGGLRSTNQVARRLAGGGLVALALCYFGCPDTPETLENVNVEIVMEAVAYLQSRPDTIADKVGLLGLSRGAELALISGVLDPAAGPVVSIMGSPWVWGSLPAGGTAWLYQGKPLPFVAIPVEQTGGPILLLHGERDSIWPVSHSYLLAERLETRGHGFELVVYPRSAHDLGLNPFDVLNRAIAFLHQNLAP